MQKDLTSGSVFKTILYFSLPYLLSYFLQTLYGMADLFIIGQFDGVASTTAVSIGSQVMHMLTVMIVGLAMGTTVMIGRAIGAKQEKQAAHVIGNTVILFLSVAIGCTVILLLCVRPIVSVMSTPEEAVSGTIAYLTVCFIGIPFITAYNIIASIFRGIGDSRTPMYFIAIACVYNIALDYLFIGAMHMGPAGAALGTTLSQVISVILSLIYIVRKKVFPALSRDNFRPQGTVMSSMLKIGLPIALQDGLIQISFIIITIFANQRGLTDAAAVGIVEKLISFIFLVPSSMLSTVSALSAQNIGAGKHDRSALVLKYAVTIAVIYGIAVTVIMQFAAQSVVGLFTTDEAVAVMGAGYMHSYVFDCIFAGIHFSCSGYFCAYGLSGISFLHNILGIILARLPLSYYTSKVFLSSLFPMGLAAPAGSAVSVIICVIALIWMKKHKEKIYQGVTGK